MKLKRGYREDVLIMNSSWKGWFPPGTLEKGLDHYESGAVSDLKTTECGYEAVVLGSREYHVAVSYTHLDVYKRQACVKKSEFF